MSKSIRIGNRLFFYMILIGIIATLISTWVNLYINYKMSLQYIKNEISVTTQNQGQKLAKAISGKNVQEIQNILREIAGNSLVDYVELSTAVKKYAYGALPEKALFTNHQLIADSAQNKTLGELTVVATQDDLKEYIKKKFKDVLFSELPALIFAILATYLLLEYMICHHINSISRYVKNLNFNTIKNPLILRRHKILESRNDEIDDIVDTVNSLRNSLLQGYVAKRKVYELSQTLKHKAAVENDQLGLEKDLRERYLKSAHEISNLVGISLTAADYLKFQSTEEKVREFSDIIHNCLIKAAEILKINDQNEYGAEDEISKFNLKSLLNQVVQNLKPQLSAQGHEVSIQGENLEMVSHARYLFQVLTNLVLNSLKHAYPNRRNGKISINVEKKGRNVVINYADDGIGLNEKSWIKVTENFSTTQEQATGSGLGLAIIQELVKEKLQGEIKLDCSKQTGSSFIITLPIEVTPS